MGTYSDRDFARKQESAFSAPSNPNDRSPFNLEPSRNTSGMDSAKPYSLDVFIKPDSIQLEMESPQSGKGKQKSLELNLKGFGSQDLGNPMKLFRGVSNFVSRLGFGERNGKNLDNPKNGNPSGHLNGGRKGQNANDSMQAADPNRGGGDRNPNFSQQVGDPRDEQQRFAGNVSGNPSPNSMAAYGGTRDVIYPSNVSMYARGTTQPSSYNNLSQPIGNPSGYANNYPNVYPNVQGNPCATSQMGYPSTQGKPLQQNWLGNSVGNTAGNAIGNTVGGIVGGAVGNAIGNTILNGNFPRSLPQPANNVTSAEKPIVGIIDTGYAPGQHGNQVFEAISSANPQASFQLEGGIGSGGLAHSLENVVQSIKESGRPGVINISSDLTQQNPDGSVTTRTTLTSAEDKALSEAQKAGIPVVVSAGNQAESRNSWGQAAQKYDNVILTGATQGFDRAPYSSYGKGLDLAAPGSKWGTALMGTSLAAAEVTGTVSQMLTVNPDLKPAEIEGILKATAVDLKQSGWDAETGNGLMNAPAAVNLASVVKELKAGLSKTSGISASNITFKDAKLAQWSQPNLGGTGFTPAVVRPGYEVKLNLAGKEQIYRTDRTGSQYKLTQEIGRNSIVADPTKNTSKSVQPIPTPSGSTGSQNAKEINQTGIDLIKRFEGLRTNAYQDTGGKWTIGYGHTGSDVSPGKAISAGEAESLLKKDVDWAEEVVQETVKVPLNSNQFSAVTSLVYNIGSGNFAKSPVLQNLNAGKYQEAADAFASHNRGGGKVLQGLINRRAAEKELFLKPDAAPTDIPKEMNKGSAPAQKQEIPTSSNLTDKLLETARSYIGVREQGGNNRGAKVEEFQRAVDGKAVGEPWCMSFVQHCIKSTEAASKVDSKVFSSEHCLTVWNKSPQELKLSKPERGSLAIWQYGNSSSGHVGIVEQVNADGTFTTIEGNTSRAAGDREGDGVYSKKHSTKSSGDRRLVGFLKVF